uniref:Uncharacterized protein n=1 Tax=Phlegmariurus squarrosus TaxID=73615 RepID=H9M892_PHLSQ|nr:hypothetical protein HusqMp120 [Phlegmariurus squarrosus]AEV55799.1 hypothetical protein HusqMp120 [Phlegmariurus squarrosus]
MIVAKGRRSCFQNNQGKHQGKGAAKHFIDEHGARSSTFETVDYDREKLLATFQTFRRCRHGAAMTTKVEMREKKDRVALNKQPLPQSNKFHPEAVWLRCGACCPRSGNWLKAASRKMSVPVPFNKARRPPPLSAPLRQISTMLAAIILPSLLYKSSLKATIQQHQWPTASIAGGLLLTRAISARGGGSSIRHS